MPGRSFLWHPADGSLAVDLNGGSSVGYRMQVNTTGLLAPTYQMTTERYAGMDGGRTTQVVADARTIVLDLLVQGTTVDEFRQRLLGLVRLMRPKAGPGVLEVVDEAGSSRTITGLYTEGLEGTQARGTSMPGRWFKAQIHLLCDDPWWYGEQVDLGYVLGPAPAFFPIFPLRFQRNDIAGATPVENLGDEDAYPVWRVTGPGSGITLTNETTGQSIALSTVLAAGESLVIDTRPFLQSVIKSDGTNLFGDLQTDPVMWALTPGTNSVVVAMGGATSDSSVAISYRPRYAGIA